MHRSFVGQLDQSLTTCASRSDAVCTQFYCEASAFTDTGQFGNSNLNNQLVQTDDRQHTCDLANRFRNEVLTTVNFALNSAASDAVARDTLNEQAE